MLENNGEITIEDARIIFRNFEGRKEMYNEKGDRGFCVLLDEDAAKVLQNDGWKVKFLKPREEGDEPQAYLPVAVKYGFKDPRVIILTRRGRTTLDEDTIGLVDAIDIEKVDLTVRPYNWEVRGERGVKAYLKVTYIKVREDYLDEKYQDVPEIEIGGKMYELEAGPEYIDVEEV